MRGSLSWLRQHYGNPVSLHMMTDAALIAMLVEQSRSQVDPALQEHQRATVEQAAAVIRELTRRLDATRCPGCLKSKKVYELEVASD